MKKILLTIFVGLGMMMSGWAQPIIDYGTPTDYEIGSIRVEGNKYTDSGALVSISGLKVGDKIKIPGETIPKTLKKLWKLRLFTDVEIKVEDKIGDVLKLVIKVKELPRLARYSYTGVKKSKHDDLNEAVTGHLHKGGIVTENVKVNATTAIRNYFIDKGFLDAKIEVKEETVVIDANHPLAGKDLIFDLEVVEIKDPETAS